MLSVSAPWYGLFLEFGTSISLYGSRDGISKVQIVNSFILDLEVEILMSSRNQPTFKQYLAALVNSSPIYFFSSSCHTAAVLVTGTANLSLSLCNDEGSGFVRLTPVAGIVVIVGSLSSLWDP